MTSNRPRRPKISVLKLSVFCAAGALVAAACGSPSGSAGDAGQDKSGGAVIQVVAAENFWGSIASQLGGVHVHVTSIITNPNTDPHAYEPTPKDARRVASAQMVVVNGIGYDAWSDKLLAADTGTPTVLRVGELLKVKDGDNPHRWYNPADVDTVVTALTADYSKIDPPDSSYFRSLRTEFETTALSQYHNLINEIRGQYSGIPVGASESIFSMMAPALGLNLITPPSFLRAISEGTDVSAGDKSTIDRQIKEHQIKVYIYNSQNTTPDVQAQLAECKGAGIPTATITETLVPPTSTFQAWQVRQLQGILATLETGTRK